MDLHLEHLRKYSLRDVSFDVTECSVILAETSIEVVKHICDVFESSNGHKPDSASPSFNRDCKLVLILKDNTKHLIVIH